MIKWEKMWYLAKINFFKKKSQIKSQKAWAIKIQEQTYRIHNTHKKYKMSQTWATNILKNGIIHFESFDINKAHPMHEKLAQPRFILTSYVNIISNNRHVD